MFFSGKTFFFILPSLGRKHFGKQASSSNLSAVDLSVFMKLVEGVFELPWTPLPTCNLHCYMFTLILLPSSKWVNFTSSAVLKVDRVRSCTKGFGGWELTECQWLVEQISRSVWLVWVRTGHQIQIKITLKLETNSVWFHLSFIFFFFCSSFFFFIVHPSPPTLF